MDVLVTGGAGYLGCVLVPKLLAQGHRVTVVDRLAYGGRGLYGCCADERFEFVLGDVRDEALMRGVLKKADAILPLAALVGMPLCKRNPTDAQSTNYDAIVLLNRLRSKSQRVIYPCTNSGYGTKSGEVFCTEDSPLEPISLYGRSKAEAEKHLLGSENVVTFRFATVFGVSPRMRLDLLVNDFTHRAVTDRFLVLYEAHFKRNYLHIEDACEAFLFGLGHFEDMKGEAYNAGLADANLSKLELAEKIKEFVPELSIHLAEVGEDPDKRNYIVSNEKLKARGFEARRTLELGIRQLLKAFRLMPAGEMHNA